MSDTESGTKKGAGAGAFVFVSKNSISNIKQFMNDDRNMIITDDNDVVVAVSWRAALKTMNEDMSKSEEKVKSILGQLFLSSDEPIGVQSNKQHAVIAFVHGVHALGVAAAKEGVPAFQTSIPERYRWVVGFLGSVSGADKAHVDSMLRSIMREQKVSDAADPMTFYALLKAPKEMIDGGWLFGSTGTSNNETVVDETQEGRDLYDDFGNFDVGRFLYAILGK